MATLAKPIEWQTCHPSIIVYKKLDCRIKVIVMDMRKGGFRRNGGGCHKRWRIRHCVFLMFRWFADWKGGGRCKRRGMWCGGRNCVLLGFGWFIYQLWHSSRWLDIHLMVGISISIYPILGGCNKLCILFSTANTCLIEKINLDCPCPSLIFEW
jgi:hypothetical protein